MLHKLVRFNPKSVAKWEHQRQAGKKSYVWRVGVLGWGVPMFIVMTGYFYVQQHGTNWPSIESFPILFVSISAVVWLIAGYWFGSTMWSTMEKAYRAYQE